MLLTDIIGSDKGKDRHQRTMSHQYDINMSARA